MDIYQQIWDEDQKHNGLKAVHVGAEITEALRASGYVIVNEDPDATPEHRVIEEAFIPEHKQQSYRLARQIFNNYTLDQTKRENDFPEEEAEVQQFLKLVHDTGPLALAREIVNEKLPQHERLSADQWWSVLQRIWFEKYDDGNNRDLSGFEHVVVGEQQQGKVKGYHSWYKYYLDERFRRDDDGPLKDTIGFVRWLRDPDERTPELATLAYHWQAFDYEREEYRPLHKKIGGFWIGPSTEGLMALGTVRFMAETMAPKHAEINGVRYALPLYRSPNRRHLRTFWPEFAGNVQ